MHSKKQKQRLHQLPNYSYALGSTYMDIVSQCERLGDYVMNVVEARLN